MAAVAAAAAATRFASMVPQRSQPIQVVRQCEAENAIEFVTKYDEREEHDGIKVADLERLRRHTSKTNRCGRRRFDSITETSQPQSFHETQLNSRKTGWFSVLQKDNTRNRPKAHTWELNGIIHVFVAMVRRDIRFSTLLSLSPLCACALSCSLAFHFLQTPSSAIVERKRRAHNIITNSFGKSLFHNVKFILVISFVRPSLGRAETFRC